MKRDCFIDELELTDADLEFARTVHQRPAGYPRLSESEVTRMRERIERDRATESRFKALRMMRLASRHR